MVEMLKRIEEERLSIDAVRELVSLKQGKSDLPGFIRSKARGLLGKNITFTKGKKGVKLTIRALSLAELREIWERISG